MSKTQDIIDAIQNLMIQSNKFVDIKHYVQSTKDDETFDFPLCTILAESDELEQLGSTKTQHILTLTISYLTQSWSQDGNRLSYGFADGLEDLFKTNRTLTVTETVVSVYLTNKLYGLTELEESTIDGVTCQVEVTYMSDSK
tara:strand:+ start:9666 stop:10091 length:426 start_codon:yes stop_codon:yes gene_type:complete